MAFPTLGVFDPDRAEHGTKKLRLLFEELDEMNMSSPTC